MQGKVRVYNILSADVKISGSRKAVMLRGKNITLTAEGEGYAAFLGNGTYSIEDADGVKKEQNWAHPLFTEGTNPGAQGLNGPDEHGPDGKNHHSVTSDGRRSNITEANKVEASKVDP
jgi:hypothetical protein